MLRERIRLFKRAVGIKEGPIERLTPVRSATITIGEIRELAKLKIAKGVAYGETPGVWYRVRFPSTIKDPQVIAVAEARSGELPRITIKKVPDIEAKTISKIADIKAKTIRRISTTREDIEKAIRNSLGDWTVAFNWIRDAIAYGLSFIFKWVFDVIVGAQIDRVQDAMNDVISDFNDKVNKQTDKIVDAVNSVISDFNKKVNDQIDIVTDRINDALASLYDVWGIPYDVAITPVHIRNVKSDGFEFLSLGKTKIHWIAIGERL